MNHTEKTIPVWKKYSLNVSEAAEYYGIGEKRLRQIAGENEVRYYRPLNHFL